MSGFLRGPAMILAAALSVILLGSLQTARADAFSFVTSGVFSNIPASSGCFGNNTNTITCSDGRVVVFVGVSFSQEFGSSNIVNNTGPLGTFQTQNVPPSSAVGPILPEGITLTLTIMQFAPAPATGTFTGVIHIQHDPVADFNVFDFDRHEIIFEGSDYRSRFAVTGFTFPLVTYIPSGGTSMTNLPEPTTLLLFGAGLAGVGALSRKRRRRPV